MVEEFDRIRVQTGAPRSLETALRTGLALNRTAFPDCSTNGIDPDFSCLRDGDDQRKWHQYAARGVYNYLAFASTLEEDVRRLGARRVSEYIDSSGLLPEEVREY